MTKKPDLDRMLKANPKAAEHGQSIREALDAVQKLRDAGVAGQTSHLEAPYGGVAGFGKLPKPGPRGRPRTFFKRTFSA